MKTDPEYDALVDVALSAAAAGNYRDLTATIEDIASLAYAEGRKDEAEDALKREHANLES